MQLADQKQSDRDELEPILYAALINSMVQNFWAIFLGSASTAAAAVMTALKTGDVLLWPIAFLIIAIGTARAFQMRRYENRVPALTFQEAKHLEPRYWFGALVYAGIIGLWCFVVIFNNDDAVANMLCVSVTVGYTAGGAARNYGQPRVIQWHVALACGPMSLALLLHGGFYYIGLAILLVL
ncbi:MAG: diguanylate cyclase, partial [Bradyrhizobium sp.]|nr:diguanylate cyclase [Bradyrhizobium sp.]